MFCFLSARQCSARDFLPVSSFSITLHCLSWVCAALAWCMGSCFFNKHLPIYAGLPSQPVFSEQCQHGLLLVLSVDWVGFGKFLCTFLTLDFTSFRFLLTHNKLRAVFRAPYWHGHIYNKRNKTHIFILSINKWSSLPCLPISTKPPMFVKQCSSLTEHSVAFPAMTHSAHSIALTQPS